MNVKPSLTDLQRAACCDMIAAHHAGDATAYKSSAAEARRLLDAQVAQDAPAADAQDGPVPAGYAAGIAAYAAAKTPEQRERKIEVTA